MSYYQRGLPHWHPHGAALLITWRLNGSLPRSVFEQPARLAMRISAGQAFRAWDVLLDAAARGPTWLKDPRVAALVVAALQRGETERNLYELVAFVVMYNHVHVLLEPRAPAEGITHWLKGVTARGANLVLGRSGSTFWQHESYDHWARDWGEVQRIIRYIEFNPVAAGLVERVEQWPWSSAHGPTGG
jgi:putative transposase